mmetsp:Transcript_1213/g.129  ORF Transcript_1213/g.129 Transcript_1213/m.129 type:complete len:87 (+) Transcript_1213:298-558(+)
MRMHTFVNPTQESLEIEASTKTLRSQVVNRPNTAQYRPVSASLQHSGLAIRKFQDPITVDNNATATNAIQLSKTRSGYIRPNTGGT